MFNNRYFRVYSIHADAAGIDPLRDKLVPEIQKIKRFTKHEISQDERCAPDLISCNVYDGADHFWWHIMVYNGIALYTDLVEGTTLRIPDLSALINVTTDYARQNNVETVVI